MDKVKRRKLRRYGIAARDVVLIEGRSPEAIRGRLVDECEAGICVAVEGDRPDLERKQRIRVRSRRGCRSANVKYLREESPTSFRLGIEWAG